MDPEMPWLERSTNLPAEASCMLIVHITRWKDVWWAVVFSTWNCFCQIFAWMVFCYGSLCLKCHPLIRPFPGQSLEIKPILPSFYSSSLTVFSFKHLFWSEISLFICLLICLPFDSLHNDVTWEQGPHPSYLLLYLTAWHILGIRYIDEKWLNNWAFFFEKNFAFFKNIICLFLWWFGW